MVDKTVPKKGDAYTRGRPHNRYRVAPAALEAYNQRVSLAAADDGSFVSRRNEAQSFTAGSRP
jgi:hypothetical protein